MQNAECIIAENAKAFWILKLRCRLVYRLISALGVAKHIQIKSAGQNNVEMQNA
jgi:hypothetical protein